VAALLFGMLANAAQGAVIGLVRANPIIVSIAATALITGVAEAFAEHGTIYVAPGHSYGLFRGKIGGLPVEFLVLLCAAAIGQFILACTKFGRNIYMLGASYAAAEVIGLKPWRTVTGILLAIRYDAASMTYGTGYEYDAVAAVLVGGTAIKGGEGSVLRTLIGAIVIAVVQGVLLLQGFRPEWQYLIAGIIVLAMVALQSPGGRD
jgi:ribose/xylose/arabinose/galactoside ABC-type transport system permease subunit